MKHENAQKISSKISPNFSPGFRPSKKFVAAISLWGMSGVKNPGNCVSAGGVAIANHCAIVNLLCIVNLLQRSIVSTAGSFGEGLELLVTGSDPQGLPH